MIKDLWMELPEALKSYIPQYVQKRKDELSLIKTSIEKRDSQTILKLAHNNLGTAASYKLFQLEKYYQELENLVKSEQWELCHECYQQLNKYLSSFA